MNRLGKTLFPLLGFCLISLLTACGALENSNRAQIVQIRDFYPIRSHSDKNGPDVYNVVDLSVKTKCGPARAMLSPASLGITEDEFAKKWLELRKNTGQERFYKFSYGECVDDGVFVTKIVDCAEGACGKDYKTDTGKLWLNTWAWAGDNIPMTRNGQYTSASKKNSAQYFVDLPLKEVPEKGAWKAEIRYSENPDVIAMDAYVDNPDFLLGKFILDYKARYLSGNLYREGAFDRQGKEQGKVVHYYDSPEKISGVSHYLNGRLDGEYVSYNENGTLAEKSLFQDNRDVTKNGVVYGPNGEVLKRYNYNDKGNKDGQQVSYYPDGKVKSRENYVNGSAVGREEHYWPNGKIKLRKTYKNGRRVAEENWYESGQKASESFNNERHQSIGTHKKWYENGKQSSEYRYHANGVRVAMTHWNKDGSLSYRETYDSKGKQLSGEDWFDNGKRKSRKTYNGGQKAKEETWYDNGKLRERATFVNDSWKERETWRQNGTREERVVYTNGGDISLIEKFDKTGKLEKRYNYKR